MNTHVGFFGSPGSGKSSMGLSFPGVEQHVFGSSEEFTAKNFPERVASGDILTPVKLDWMQFLKDEEKALFRGDTKDEAYLKASDMDQERKLKEVQQVANARKMIRYTRYIKKTKLDLLEGRRTELKSVFLDNGTPFLDDYIDYMKVVRGHEFRTGAGNWDSIKFSIEFGKEISDFFEMFNSMECNTAVSFHIKLTVDEENAGKVDFMNDAKTGKKYPKEWHPMVMGQFKYQVAGKFDYAFFCQVVEELGKPNRFVCRLETDAANVGIGKNRVMPFEPGKPIEPTKNKFYEFLVSAIEKKLAVNQGGSK